MQQMMYFVALVAQQMADALIEHAGRQETEPPRESWRLNSLRKVNRMTKNTRFSPEVRQRAVRMVLESQNEYDSLWAALSSIAPKIGCTARLASPA